MSPVACLEAAGGDCDGGRWQEGDCQGHRLRHLVTTKNGTRPATATAAGHPGKKVTRKYKTTDYATLLKAFAAPFERPDGKGGMTFAPLQIAAPEAAKFPTGENEDRFEDLDKILVALQKVDRVRNYAAVRKFFDLTRRRRLRRLHAGGSRCEDRMSVSVDIKDKRKMLDEEASMTRTWWSSTR